MSKTLKLLLVQADFDGAMVKMKKTGADYDSQVQLLAISAVALAMMHGNTNAINTLATGLSAGTRTAALTKWLGDLAPVVNNDTTDATKKKAQPFVLSRDKMKTLTGSGDNHSEESAIAYAEKINAKHWTSYKPQPVEITEWSLTDAIAQVVKKAKQMGQKSGVAILGIEALPQLEALCVECGGDTGVQSV